MKIWELMGNTIDQDHSSHPSVIEKASKEKQYKHVAKGFQIVPKHP